MNNGKEVCKRLKQVRREIAEANDISLVQEECKHQGDCMGTCPRCEQEITYLTEQLSVRKRLGKAVSIIGIAAVTGTIAVTASSCNNTGEPMIQGLMPPPDSLMLEGDIPDIESDTIPNDSLPEGYTPGIAPVE